MGPNKVYDLSQKNVGPHDLGYPELKSDNSRRFLAFSVSMEDNICL